MVTGPYSRTQGEAGDDKPIVLVIDDDQYVRDSLEGLLKSVDLRVITYVSAQAFLFADLPTAPCCLILDVRMPGLSGLDLQAELVREDVHIPIIFITGHGDIPMAVRALKAGAVNFLTKPFRDQDLLDAVIPGPRTCPPPAPARAPPVERAYPIQVAHPPGAGDHGTARRGAGQQTDRPRTGDQRGDGETPPQQHGAEDGRAIRARLGLMAEELGLQPGA